MHNQPSPLKIRDLARQTLRQALVNKIPKIVKTANYCRVFGRQQEYETLINKLEFFRKIDNNLLLILNCDFDAKYCAYPSETGRPRTPSPLRNSESPSSSRSSSPPDLDDGFAAVAVPETEDDSGEPEQKRSRNS